MKKFLLVVLVLAFAHCPGPIDTDPPLVVIVEPTEGSVVEKGTVEISATAADESDVITVVEFFVDGQLVGEDSTPPPPYTALWNTQSLAPGSQHRIRVLAHDGSGNVGSDSVLVSIASTLKMGVVALPKRTLKPLAAVPLAKLRPVRLKK